MAFGAAVTGVDNWHQIANLVQARSDMRRFGLKLGKVLRRGQIFFVVLQFPGKPPFWRQLRWRAPHVGKFFVQGGRALVPLMLFHVSFAKIARMCHQWQNRAAYR